MPSVVRIALQLSEWSPAFGHRENAIDISDSYALTCGVGDPVGEIFQIALCLGRDNDRRHFAERVASSALSLAATAASGAPWPRSSDAKASFIAGLAHKWSSRSMANSASRLSATSSSIALPQPMLCIRGQVQWLIAHPVATVTARIVNSS
jgi:hypothetical protein